MNAVILAGGHGTDLKPLTARVPKHLLPIGGRPGLAHTIETLRDSGFGDIGITVNGEAGYYREALGDGTSLGVRITYLQESAPQGTAGCLRAALPHIGPGPVLVVSGHVVCGTDLDRLVGAHRIAGADATVGVVDARPGAGEGARHERVHSGSDGRLHRLDVRNPAGVDREWKPAGIYLFDRSALERIPRAVYYDLKEQFIPDLLQSGAEVQSHPITGYLRGIHRSEDYLAAHWDLLRGRTGRTPAGEEVADGIWIEDGAVVDPAAILIGPLCVGRGARIEAGARIVGPTAIGRDAVVRAGALVRDSVIIDGAIVGAGARLDRCIVAYQTVVAEGTVQENAVVADAIESLGEQTLIEQELRIGVAAVPVDRYLAARGRERIYQTAKRAFDIVFAVGGLIAAAPVMALVALAIKVDSSGPVFFRQRRCGRNGRPFGMIKFRSMRRDAEEVKTHLRGSNECDGPVFKISDDPRFTRVGRLLRRYSLDELPQLWNILRGDMSVVGPRPLAPEELRMCPSWRDARLLVKPGLTGLWQVSSRDKNHFQEWIRHDLKYVKEQSLLLDMKIVWRTVTALAKGL